MAGISPSTAGKKMLDAAPLDIVAGRVEAELARERRAGQPLKAAFVSVARRLGLSPRRVRAYHHHEVAADQVLAAELLAADAAYRADFAALMDRLDAIRGLIGVDEGGDPAGAMAPGGVAAACGTRGRQGGSVGRGPALGKQSPMGEG